MSACSVCNSPTGDGANLCRTHTTSLTYLLRQIPDKVEIIDREHFDARDELTGIRNYDKTTEHPLGDIIGPIRFDKVTPGLASDLETTITRQDKLAMNPGSATSAEKPLNWNDRASNVRWELCATLSVWALETSKRYEDTRDPVWAVGRDIARIAEWMLRNINTLRLLPDAGEAYAELNDAIRRAENATDRPANATRFVVGPCPELLEDETACPGEVWAFIPISEDRPALMACQNDEGCGQVWNTTQWMRVGERIRRRIQQTGWRPTYRTSDAA